MDAIIYDHLERKFTEVQLNFPHKLSSRSSSSSIVPTSMTGVNLT